MKKLISLILIVMVLCCIAVPACADTPEDLPLPTEYPAQPVDEIPSTVNLYGTVEPSILSAEVTLSTYFAIDPNAAAESRFISPSMTAKNTSTMPIEVYAQSMKATGTAPMVVAWDQYTQEQWDTLGTADTHANIALGLIGTEIGDFWFPAEALQVDNFPVAGLDSQEEILLGLQCRHGLSWAEAENFRYELVFLITMQD